MRTSGIVLLGLTLGLTTPLHCQFGYLMPGQTDQGVFIGGMGFSVIDDQTFVTFNFYPELAFGKVGIGLDIPLRFNTQTGDLREEDWDETYDYFRILRFIRYGQKREPVYARLGELDAVRLGHGFIVNFYNNHSVNYDRRKIGLVFDIDAGVAGFESITSNLGRAEILGIRGYYRPFFHTETPIIRNFAIGASFVTDVDPDENRKTGDDVIEYGLDIEVPVIKTPIFQTLLYADYAKIASYGSGRAAGIELSLQGTAGTFNLVAQLERRFLNAEFIPAYFDAFYEIDRYRPTNVDTVFFRKEDLLVKQPKTRGTFGLLRGTVLNTLDVIGTFEKLDGVPNSGILHLYGNVPNTVPKISARASYSRVGIGNFADAFKLDDRSIARLGFGYKLNAFIVVYMDYIWTYRFDPATNTYKSQRRVEPSLSLVYPFPIGMQ